MQLELTPSGPVDISDVGNGPIETNTYCAI